MAPAANFGSKKGAVLKIFKIYNTLQRLHNFEPPALSCSLYSALCICVGCRYLPIISKVPTDFIVLSVTHEKCIL